MNKEQIKIGLQIIGVILFVILFFGSMILVLRWSSKDDAKREKQKEIIFFECTQDNSLEWCYKYILKGDFDNK